MPYVGTCRGRLVNPLDDTLRNSNTEILAQECFGAISRKNRYNGHTSSPYTVGQHTLILCNIVAYCRNGLSVEQYNNLAQTVLFHDMHEAFCGDMPRPLKAVLPEYTAFEEKIKAQIQGNLWQGLGEATAFSEKFLNILDTDICVAWEMPYYDVGFYEDVPFSNQALIASLQKMLFSLTYRDLMPPEVIREISDVEAMQKLLDIFEEIADMDSSQTESALNALYRAVTGR